MIRKCTENDVPTVCEIINDAALAYKGVIPADRWHEPYMALDELRREIDDGVEFWGLEADGRLVGVMGIQEKGEVNLIRHAYVRTTCRNQGIGSQLLHYLERMANKPILIGTWADATWAVRFYQKNQYQLLGRDDTERLLQMYWKIPRRQVETSVVLASPGSFGAGLPVRGRCPNRVVTSRHAARGGAHGLTAPITGTAAGASR